MKLHLRPNPHRCAFTPAVLARAAWLLGRGYPLDHVAGQLHVDGRALRVELNRIGIDRDHVTYADTSPDLVLQMRLSREERTTLGVAALDREMYRPALGCLIVRTVLHGGRPLLDAVLDDGGCR